MNISFGKGCGGNLFIHAKNYAKCYKVAAESADFTYIMQLAAKFPKLPGIFLLPILEVLGKLAPITLELWQELQLLLNLVLP
jgi:hypothetical protein